MLKLCFEIFSHDLRVMCLIIF